MMASPLIILMANAFFFGTLAVIMNSIAVSVDSWQRYSFDPFELNRINGTNSGYTILRLSPTKSFFKVISNADLQSNTTANNSKYLYPSYTGLWKVCDLLTDEERALIPKTTQSLNVNRCFVFVTDYNEESGTLPDDSMQIARLHNSAASCYIVVLIDLVTATIVGIIGITQKQVASCMVTGVLYTMAALFGVFGLSMFHTKHYYETVDCDSLDPIPAPVCSARNVEILWAIPIAWFGVIFSIIAATLWLIVARALRVIKAKTML